MPSKEAMAIAAEHIDWAIDQGFNHCEIIASVGLDRHWLWPTRDEMVEAFATIWTRRLRRVEVVRDAA
jgi:hypothetical protein